MVMGWKERATFLHKEVLQVTEHLKQVTKDRDALRIKVALMRRELDKLHTKVLTLSQQVKDFRVSAIENEDDNAGTEQEG